MNKLQRSSYTPSRQPRRARSTISLWLAAFALAALPATTRSLAQAPTFNSVQLTSTASQPWQMPRSSGVGDFDGDGKLDAIVADTSPLLRFMQGNGDGTFTEHDISVDPITVDNIVGLPNDSPIPAYLPHAVDGYIKVRSADLNGDGKPDLVCETTVHLNFAPYSLVSVMINAGNDVNGVPQFTVHHYWLGGYDLRSLTVGDLNADGKPDFIIGWAYGQVEVFLNQGDGTFALSQYTGVLPAVGGAVGLGAIADVNGDGKADFIVTDNQASATDVFLGNGDGTFQPPLVIANLAVAVAVADLNKDGKPDLILGFVDGSITVSLGNGDGTFGTPTSYSTVPNGFVTGFAISDMNYDGKLDVIASLSVAGGTTIAIINGNGDGTLSPISTIYSGIPNPVDLNLADFTGDGKLDIGAPSAFGYGGQDYGVFVNTTVPPLTIVWQEPHQIPEIERWGTVEGFQIYAYDAQHSAPAANSVEVKFTVQGITASTGQVFDDVTVALAAGRRGVVDPTTGDRLMTYQGLKLFPHRKKVPIYGLDLRNNNFLDHNTLAEADRYYLATVQIIDKTTGTVLGSSSIHLETTSH